MNAYMFQAAWWCEDCIARDHGHDYQEPVGPFDSGDSPAGPYPDGGGEADTPQHCDSCGRFLENALTADGTECVRELAAQLHGAERVSDRYFKDLVWSSDCIEEWADFYGITAPDATGAAATLEDRVNAKLQAVAAALLDRIGGV